jgi:hypothetical protein
MDRSKSSRVAHMKYSYELKYQYWTEKIKEKKFVVHESLDGISMTSHGINFIIKKKNSEVFYGTPLERMYYWLKENHPELLI